MSEYRLFEGVSGGARENDPDALNGASLGTEFYVTNTGRAITRLWYYHPVGTGDTAIRTGRIYTVTGQAAVVGTDVTFPVGVSGTWMSADLAAPVALAANTHYKVVILHPQGHFALTGNYWTADRTITDLTAPSSSNSNGGGQCTYSYGATIQYPTSTFNRSNYWSDVTVTDAPPQTITPAGIPSAVALGSPVLAPGAAALAPAGIPSGAALGQAALLPGAVTITPAGIAPTTQIGQPTVTGGSDLGPWDLVHATGPHLRWTARPRPGRWTAKEGRVRWTAREKR